MVECMIRIEVRQQAQPERGASVAKEWYRSAAEKGDADAMRNLGDPLAKNF
jgi:TPR repeat protein